MVFLCSVSHSSKLVEPKEEVVRTSHLQPVTQKSPGNNLNLRLASKIQGGGHRNL